MQLRASSILPQELCLRTPLVEPAIYQLVLALESSYNNRGTSVVAASRHMAEAGTRALASAFGNCSCESSAGFDMAPGSLARPRGTCCRSSAALPGTWRSATKKCHNSGLDSTHGFASRRCHIGHQRTTESVQPSPLSDLSCIQGDDAIKEIYTNADNNFSQVYFLSF